MPTSLAPAQFSSVRGAEMAPAARILVADDDANIAELVRLYLTRHGFKVDLALDGARAQTLLEEVRYDLAVLDITMPGASGLQIVRSLRLYSSLPVIFLTARTSDIDKVTGLYIGADDYVTKPFNPRELVARIEAVLRRSQPESETAGARIAVGQLELDVRGRQAWVGDALLILSPKEFDLLATMMRLPRVVLDRRKLLDLVW